MAPTQVYCSNVFKIRHLALYLSLVVVFTTLYCVGWLSYHWYRCVNAPLLVANNGVNFDLAYGTSVTKLAAQLQQQGLFNNSICFVALARVKRITHKLQAGTYRITPNMTVSQLLNEMGNGKVILHALTIVDGWTFADLLNAVNHNSYLTHTLATKNQQQIMQALGENGQNPEGQFFPDTYLFAAGVSDITLLKKAHLAMITILQEAWLGRAHNLPYKNPYQALILASLIEKETALPIQKPIVAGVLLRRLQQRMMLQVDPTVMYGIRKSYNGTITKKDLLKNTPYNTYKHYGLPPTPIAFPDEVSIYAAMHPTSGTALYYVANGDGSHHFSNTLAEHRLAVARYRLIMLKKQQLKRSLNQLAFPSCNWDHRHKP